MDKCYICYADLTCLSTAENGIVKYENNEFKLDVPKWTMTCYHVANAGANCIRLLPYGVWLCPSKEAIFCPFKFHDGKWDLNIWNPDYFIIVQKAISIANKYGLTVWFDLFDNCQKFPDPVNAPFWNNHQGFDGFYDPRCDTISTNFILSMHDILKNVDAIYGCGNEMEWAGIDFCNRVIYPVLKDLNIHPSKIAYGSNYQLGTDYNSKIMEWMKERAEAFWGENRNYILRPTHNILSPSNVSSEAIYGQYAKEVLDSWGHNPLRIALSDDGTWDGTSGCDYFIYNNLVQRRPSAISWNEFCKYVMVNYPTMADGYPKFVFEHCPKSEDVAGCQVNAMKAISNAYFQAYGVYPSNYNKYSKPDLKKHSEDDDDYWQEQLDKRDDSHIIFIVAVVIMVSIVILGICC